MTARMAAHHHGKRPRRDATNGQCAPAEYAVVNHLEVNGSGQFQIVLLSAFGSLAASSRSRYQNI
jgi:hypothetical protein